MKMPHLQSLLLCGLIAGASLPVSAALTPQEQQKRTKDVEALMRETLTKFEAAVDTPKKAFATRDISHAALAYMMLGEGAAKAQAMIERFFPLQDMDLNSPSYGKVPWDPSKPEVRDDNAIEFLGSELGPLLLLYGNQFPQSFIDELTPHLKAALAAIARHRVGVQYTNIALMKAANQILIGEYLKDTEATDAGRKLLDEWIAFTRKNGVHEFDSPTYSQTQMDVLYGLYHCVKDPVVKSKAKVALDYLWADFSANYFPGTQSMSGPNSRSYSFLSQNGNINQKYYLNGLPSSIGAAFLNDEVQIWAPAIWNDYNPPAEALALATEPTRLIRQRCGEKPGQDRTNFITPDFTIGSASRSYCSHDRLVVAALASAKKLPVISVVPDMSDSPYGKFTEVEKGGHKKVHHLEAVISAVQQKGQVLAIYDLAPPLAKSDVESVKSVATNVLLPLKADSITVNGAPVAWANGAVPVPPDSVICVREGKGAVAIRLFADAAPGATVSYFLKNDGEAWDAARLVAYQYQGAPVKLTPPSLHSGVLLLASSCESKTDEEKLVRRAKAWTFTQTESGNLWKVTATSGTGAKAEVLEASIDTPAKQTGPRLINGQEAVSPILKINGTDWAEKIWKNLPESTAK